MSVRLDVGDADCAGAGRHVPHNNPAAMTTPTNSSTTFAASPTVERPGASCAAW